MKVLLALLAVLIGAAVAAALAGASGWKRATHAAVGRLSPDSSAPASFDADAVASLPQPVARYLRTAITNGHPIVRAAIATQAGEFYLNGDWRSLTATQHFSVTPPGFVWDARIETAALIPAYVRDAYLGGRGSIQAAIFGAYTIVDQHDAPELDSGALQRFLGESIWFPTALLPSAAITWTAHDDRSALVTLKDRANSVTLLFEFGNDGMPATISGDRYKEDRGRYTMQPWQIHCEGHEMRDGLTIPLRCEAAWLIGGTREPYWRGRITSIDYQYDRME